MQYIIMCGGTYKKWETPRHLTEFNGESLVARTIRLLREEGVTDIAISSNNSIFRQFGVPVLQHANNYVNCESGFWVDAFYPMVEPTCYICGDVLFSPEAIHTIVTTETDSVEFFASAPDFSDLYIKPWAEPFAFKVVDTAWFREAIDYVKFAYACGAFERHPIAWELWQVLKDTELNTIDYTNYTVINDYTCDIDSKEDIDKIYQKLDRIWL